MAESAYLSWNLAFALILLTRLYWLLGIEFIIGTGQLVDGPVCCVVFMVDARGITLRVWMVGGSRAGCASWNW